jgi:hypothetical protein
MVVAPHLVASSFNFIVQEAIMANTGPKVFKSRHQHEWFGRIPLWFAGLEG